MTTSESESDGSAEYQNVTVRVTKEKAERLSQEADERGVSRAQFLRELIDNREALFASGSEQPTTDDNSTVSDEKLTELREKLTDARESMHEEREERIRYEERVTLLETEKERAIEEKNSWQNRYHEANGKLKLHNSERESNSRSFSERLKSWFSRE